jgi:hypothetical protein
MIDTTVASQLLGVAPETMIVWRCRHHGPPFIKLERGGIRYLLRDLKQYIRQGRVVPKANTAEVST